MIHSSQIFNAYSTGPSHSEINIGDISDDHSAIVGVHKILFLYGGSNNYYQQYGKDDLDCIGEKWANLTYNRHLNLSKNTQIISLFVPNKATCLPDLYPLPLDIVPTPAFSALKSLLQDNSGVLFCNNLINASSSEKRKIENPWRLVDSHWTKFAALMTANEILERLGLPPISFVTNEFEPKIQYGDLSQKFSPHKLTEYCHQEIIFEACDPTKIFDSGGNSLYQGSVGRRVTWENNGSNINLHLLIVGNSFSGLGDDQSHLTFWLAHVFKKVTFLHSGHIPSDALDFYAPDIILFQGLERFLISVPDDNLKASQVESFFK